jgi:hypothetical protein
MVDLDCPDVERMIEGVRYAQEFFTKRSPSSSRAHDGQQVLSRIRRS